MVQGASNTGLSLIVEWANEQDHWVRALVSEIIKSRKAISDEKAKEFYDVLLREKELRAGEAPAVPRLEGASILRDDEYAFTLLKLSDVERVNALTANQELEFNRRMTVLFGENAAGKSGYVRILKRVASVRAAEPILPNVLAPSTPGKPHATLTYQLGEQEAAFDWNGEEGLSPFTRIDVFDTRCLLHHVDQELTYVYTPADLSLFPLVHDAIEKVKKLLDEARRDTTPKGNPFLNKFKREDSVYTKVESLGPSTDLAALEELAKVSPEEEAGLDALRERVDALRAKATDARIQVATTERDLYDLVSETLQTVHKFDCEAYSDAVAELTKAEGQDLQATKEAFAGQPIPGVLEGPWRSFVESGEAYLQELEIDDYPRLDEPCIYCRQPLTQAAVELLTKYRDFCNSAFKQAVQTARAKRDGLTREVQNLESKRIKADLDKKKNAIQQNEPIPPILSKSVDFIVLAENLRRAVDEGKAFESDALDPLITELRPLLDKHRADLEKLISELSQQANERKEAFDREAVKLHILEARITLRELFPQIKAHVEAAKWASQASTLLTRLGHTVGKSLTETSKIASEELLNQNFEASFQTECEELRAPRVRLDFPGRKGQAARRKTLVADHRLSDILSEGEQKVLALADFIAEASLRRKASPIIFDDPVTSLDYRRLEYVVKRLVELSASRQVIVFTHSIWLATALLAAFEKDTDACSYFDVTESNGSFGIITRGSHPRWDTVKQTKSRINKLIQDATAASGETQQALIERTYGYIRNLTEIIVEQELFCGVTQRYSPHVAMTKLPAIKPDRLNDAIRAIYPLYEKSCRIIEAHSQPLETLGTRPTLDGLKADWAALLSARDAYVKA